MFQKELAKRLSGRFETEPDGDGWLAVSSDWMPLCRVKYNGNCIVNDNPYLSEEHLGKIAEVQNDLLTVKEYVALYEHAQQMKAAEVSEYRQLASFSDTVLAAKYSENHGFEFVTWKQNADGRAVFWGDYSPSYEYAKESFAVRSGLIPQTVSKHNQEIPRDFVHASPKNHSKKYGAVASEQYYERQLNIFYKRMDKSK